MKNQSTVFSVLHICDYAAPYRGNFIDSLESIEQYHCNIKNYYLFPRRAQNNPDTLQWIAGLNSMDTVAYIQEANFLGNAWLLWHILRKQKICRIVRHFPDVKIDILVRLLYGDKKVIRFFHTRFMKSNSSVKHFLKKLLWKNNKLVGVSEAIADELRDVFPEYFVTVVDNAINFRRLDAVEFFEHPNKLCLMMMGRDRETKGVDLAIKACEMLRPKYDFVLRIISGRNPEMVREVIIDVLGEMVDWIEILPPNNNVGTYFVTNDIFLSPSRHEAFGYANVEAAYCENSVVLTRVGGQKQLHIEGAYWVEPNSVEDLAEKIETAINEFKTPERIAQRAAVKEQVQLVYSLKEWSNRVVTIILG